MKTLLWAGRKIKLKNLDLLLDLSKEFPVEIATGISHEELQEKIMNCHAVLLPSYSEVCPNFILEAVSFGKPFIMTEETGLREIYDKGGIFVNPFDKKALKQAISDMLDDAKYEQYKNGLASVRVARSWSDVARDFINICQ